MKVNCEVCGASFPKRPRDVKRTANNYCSNKCRGVGMRNHDRNGTDSRTLTNCDNCGKGIIKYYPGENNFCSGGCPGRESVVKVSKLIGREFGSFKVLELDGKKVKCQCNCGEIYSMYMVSLKRMGNKDGCKKCSNQVNSSYFSSLKSGAKSRGLVLEISKEDVWSQFLKQDRRCALSGIQLTWQDVYRKGEHGTASVDRRDSKVGYTKDNIQIVHKDVNRMKWDFDEAYFIEMCGKIFNKASKEV